MLKAAVLAAAVLALAAHPALAEPLTVETDRAVYHYGDTFTVLIMVEGLTEPFATMHIRDADGRTSSPINVPLNQLNNSVPALAPFDRTVFPAGTYEVSVTYAGMTAVTTFDLVDVGTVVVPNWIKEVAFLWISGTVSGVEYLNILGGMVDEGLLVPSGDAEPFIPPWLVSPTAWWLGGLITDDAYVTILQYLVDDGIITGLKGLD